LSKKVLWPSKDDVDGFHPENFGKMALDMTNFIPATPSEFKLLERYGVETKGKHTVVIGRSHCGSPNEYFDRKRLSREFNYTLHTATLKILKNYRSGRYYYYRFGCS
jgi:hypothetical protein